MHAIGLMSFVSSSTLSLNMSLMIKFVSMSTIGILLATAGRFNAVDATLRRRLQDSSHGDVPTVKPCDDETTEWKVWNIGLDIRADWFVIQICLMLSNVFATTTRCILLHRVNFDSQVGCTYSVSQSNLEDSPVSL